MVERWLILQWDGRWGIPDHWHGGIFPGPYTSKTIAECAIVNYAGKQSDFCDSKEEAEKEYLSVFSRHTVVSVNWPANELGPK